MNKRLGLIMYARNWLSIAVVCLGLAACGGGSQSIPGPSGAPAPAPRRTAEDVIDLTPANGLPGQDYSAEVIEVGYLPGAALPPDLAGGPLPDQRADSRSNDILRQNSDFAEITDAIAGRYGLVIRHQVYIGRVNIASFNLPPGSDGDAILTRLRTDFAAVLDFAGYTPIARAAFTPNDPDFNSSSFISGDQWGQWKIGCRSAWDHTRGAEHVRIGVVDTGCRLSHEELDGQVLVPVEEFPTYQLDLYNDDNTVEDTNGHGTKIAGLIVAKTDNARTIAGVADHCRVIPVKIAETTETALYADMAAGCMLAAVLGAQVVNLSWTGSTPSNALSNMVDELAARGVLLVVAAGNDGSPLDSSYPGAYDGCMAVGATDESDVRLDFSNYGSYVDIAAPGHNLKTCHYQGITEYREVEGTSFAAPLVAAGAALLWTHAPSLSLMGMRNILETTGSPAYDFNETHVVKRLDLGAAFDAVLTIDVPSLDRLAHRDSITFEPVVSRPVIVVRLLVNGAEVSRRTVAPYRFDLDLSSYGHTVLDVVIEAIATDSIIAERRFSLLVDNTTGIHMMNETFDDDVKIIYPLDPRDYSDAVLTSLKQLDPGEWTLSEVRNSDPHQWVTAMPGVDGTKACRLANPGHDYLNRRTELLATPCLNLKGMVDATLSFTTHHNFADGDIAHLLYTTDSGQTFTVFEDGGTPVQLTGHQAEFLEYNLDLSDLLGQKIHFVFLFESNAAEAGAVVEEDASWWLDNVTLDGTTVALSNLIINMPSVPGTITGATEFSVTPQGPINVGRVEYWLDFAPLGVEDDYDIMTQNDTPPFGAAFDVTPALAWINQAAVLRIQPVGLSEFRGEELQHPVYVFNYRGDVNADGVVDDADTAGYIGKVGLDRYKAGYTPLLDADLDGLITEYDANWVGYMYGVSGE